MEIRSVGIDLGKTTFHLVALGDNCKVLLKKKFTQKQLIAFTANLQTSLIGMEACSGALPGPYFTRTRPQCEEGAKGSQSNKEHWDSHYLQFFQEAIRNPRKGYLRQFAGSIRPIA
jgi:hypothetical protein